MNLDAKLSPHFTLREALHTDTGMPNDPPTETLLDIQETAWWLEGIRALVGKPFIVTSWFRSPLVNEAVGGVAASDHQFGYAVDGYFAGLRDRVKVEKALGILIDRDFPFDQVIVYEDGRVHLSKSPRLRGQFFRG